MKLSECPELYKIYKVVMSNDSSYKITGNVKKAIMEAKSSWVELPDGNLINKNFVVEFKLDMEDTRDNVRAHAEEIKNALAIK